MKLHGPQMDRNNLWKTRTADVQGNNDSTLNLLRTENDSLQDQIQRLQRELMAYQTKFPVLNVAANFQNDENNQIWPTSSDVVAPLFRAYDTRIYELNSLTKSQELMVETLKKQCADLIHENEELRAIHAANGGNNRGLDSSNVLHNELIYEMNEKVNMLLSENELLVEQKQSLGAELDKYVSESSSRVAEISQLRQQLTLKNQEILKVSHELAQTEADRAEAASQALRCSDALGKAEMEIEKSELTNDSLKQTARDLEAALLDARRNLAAQSTSNNQNHSTSFERVRICEEHVRQKHRELQDKERELEELKEAHRKLRLEFSSTRQDAEGMLQVMTGLERQLNEFSSREADVELASKNSMDRVAEALLLREQSTIREKRLEIEVDRLKTERLEIAMNQTAELEKGVARARTLLMEQIKTMRLEIEDLCARNARILGECETATRECKSAQESYKRQIQLHDNEMRTYTMNMKVLGEQLDRVSAEKEQAVGKNNDTNDINKGLRMTIDKLRTEVDSIHAQHYNTASQSDAENVKLKSLIRALQKELAEKARTTSKKTEECEELRQGLANRTSSEDKKYQEDMSTLIRRLSDTEKHCRELEAVGHANDATTKTMLEQIKEKYVAAVHLLEWKLRQEADNSQALNLKCRNFEAAISELLTHKSHLEASMHDLKSNYQLQSAQVTQYKQTVAELSNGAYSRE